MGGTDRARYSEEAQISAGSATNDFRRLVDADLVMQVGRGPATRYQAAGSLRTQVQQAIDESAGRPANPD